jgi:hypothetical protein
MGNTTSERFLVENGYQGDNPFLVPENHTRIVWKK